MPKQGFKSINIPLKMYHRLEEYVDENVGFVTVTEVVRSALRDYLWATEDK